jgi:uncharacterized protein YgfB (UPF0149 family)
LAAGELVMQGFLLPEDLAAVVTRAQALWDWIHTDPGER